MLTYGEFIATVALIVSIVRLVLDIVEYLDYYSLEGKRQDVELHLCGLSRAGRTLLLRTVTNEQNH